MNRKRMKILRRRGGFTLLELVIAMGMVAVLAVSLYASLRIGFKAQASSEAAVEPARTASLALDLIQQDLANSLTPNNLAGNFEGTSGTDDRNKEDDDINFYSTTDSPQHATANGEIKNVELTVIEPQNSSDHVLVRRVARNLPPLNQETETPDVEVICRNVGAFSVQYWDGTEWDQTWDSTQEDNQLPVAVEVMLELDRPDATSPGGMRATQYTRIFPLSCSYAQFDPQVNPSASTSSTATQ